jgi:hypothetical protein
MTAVRQAVRVIGDKGFTRAGCSAPPESFRASAEMGASTLDFCTPFNRVALISNAGFFREDQHEDISFRPLDA